MDSSVSDRFKKIYYDDLWSEIKNRCIQLNQSSNEVSGNHIAVPWFGDIKFVWRDFSKKCPKALLSHFPANITKGRLPEIASELHNLLPRTDLVKSFLPVLLSSYVTNRKKNFLQLLNNETLDISHIESQKHLWSTPSLSKNYPAMTADDVKLKSWDRGLSVYSKIIQFSLFNKATFHICDVGSSFYMFEIMTGYLHLLDADACYYIDKLARTKEKGNMPFCTPNEFNEEIKSYIEDKLCTNCNLPGDKSSVPFGFLTFLYNLKHELSKNGDIILSEDDPLEIAHQFDLNRKSYLISNMLGAFDEACNHDDS